MSGNWKNAIVATIFTMLFSFALPALAQFSQEDFGTRITIKSIPEIPGAHETVTVSLSAVSYDLNKASIKWLVGGKETDSGIGKTSTSVKTGNTGSETTVSAVITFGSLSTTKKLIIRPAEVTLLWQAPDSYTPPFYKGKALPASEALIRVVALPSLKDKSGKALKEKDFSYTWKRNYDANSGSSGYGKNSFVFRNSFMNDTETIEVTASSVSGGYVAKRSVTIPLYTPFVTVYEDRPLIGTKYETALNNTFAMNTEETTLVAEPYFFSPGYLESSDLKIDWRVDGQIVSTYPKNRLVIRSGGSGSVSIRLSAENTTKLFQSLTKNLTVQLP